MAREDLDWTNPHHVAQQALKDDDATWEDLPGVPDLPDQAEIEAGWLNGFVEGAVEVLEEVGG